MQLNQSGFQILACPDGEDALALLERIGRHCYKSEHLIDDGIDKKTGDLVRVPSSHRFIREVILKQGKTERLIDKAIELLQDASKKSTASLVSVAAQIVETCRDTYLYDPEHESVLEHVNITVVFTTDRGVTHELVRHRIASFTMESTRYCNYDKDRFGGLTFIDHNAWATTLRDKLRGRWLRAMASAEEAYLDLIGEGAPPELARGVLPHSTKADLILTTNLREWRHIFRLRTSPKAHPQMRALLTELHEEFRKRIPIVFDEI